MDWFKGKFTSESPMIFMGKSLVSGFDFPFNQSIDHITEMSGVKALRACTAPCSSKRNSSALGSDAMAAKCSRCPQQRGRNVSYNSL